MNFQGSGLKYELKYGVNFMLDQSKTYAYNSKNIKSGDSYICLPKGEPYIEEALSNGAVDVVRLNRKDFALSANEYFDHPTKRVTLIGITGTNGKTSVAYFTSQLLESCGHKVLTIGTINSSLTTPESWDLLNQIKDHADNGGTHVVLEVSSHGIDQYRVLGFHFDIKCLTNITQDHLDYHGTFDKYKATKMHFMNEYPGQSIFADQCPMVDRNEIRQLKGSFHVENVSAAMEICIRLGENQENIKSQTARLMAPKGRFEAVEAGQPFSVIIDFAHTPDALEHVLSDALKIVSGNKNRLKVIFGCGGDRDRGKRKKMGRIAETYSHQIYLTADNSRSEPTLNIINEIKQDMNQTFIQHTSLNREDAISLAIAEAKIDDLILIAGKGHEKDQVCNGFSYTFNDFDIAYSEIIKQRKHQLNQSWVLNQPDAKADVLFISKKRLSILKTAHSQFKRTIPTPSNTKIKEYLSKIKGEKIIVLESDNQLSMTEMIMRVFQQMGGAIDYIFNDRESLEYNLVGLTLIEQTGRPIVIKVNPKSISKLKKVVEVISPQHIIIGNIYNAQGFIDQPILKAVQSISETPEQSAFIWYFEQMADIKDLIEDNQNAHNIQAANWIDFMQLLIEELLIKLEMYNYSPRDIILSHVLATSWMSKIHLVNQSCPLYVVNWTEDIVLANQKVRYFLNNAKNVFHYIYLPNENQKLMDELKCNYFVNEANIIPLNIDHQTQSFKTILQANMAEHSDEVHVFWKRPENKLTILEEMS